MYSPEKFKAKIFIALSAAIISLNGCSKEESAPAPVADFSYSGNNVMAPALVTFTNESKDATSYSWNFGDGESSTVASPSHTFKTGGSYTVKLTATGTGGANTVSETFTVQNAPTKCKITRIKLTAIPFKDSSGTAWDAADGPDLFIQGSDQSGNVVFFLPTNQRKNDVTSASLPLTWDLTTPLTISPINTNLYFDFFDYDTLDPNDYMGFIGFNPTVSLQGYPTSATASQNGFTIQLTFEWE